MPVRLMILGALLILQKRIFFLGTFFLGRISLFPARGRIPFLLLILNVMDSSGYFEIPISFSHPAKRNDPNVYKDSQYLLTGLNPTPALIPS